jgi:general secretion pathway protein B
MPPAPAAPAASGNAQALASKLSLQVLSWAPDPRDRFVFLNGRRYSEGQAIEDKLIVEKINEDGVVLSYQGERVTLKGR